MEQWSQAMEWRCSGRAWLERYLHPVTAYVLLPLFALFDGGVVIDSGVAALADPVGLGVLVACSLALGSVSQGRLILIRFGPAEMPSGVNSGQIHGSAILTCVGFTMSLFVSDLAFGRELIIGFSKIGILAGSALCATVGY